MRKKLSLILAICVLLSNFIFIDASAATSYSGYCGAESGGTNIQWSFEEATGTLSLVGTGTMASWRNELSAYYEMLFKEQTGIVHTFSYAPWFSIRDKIVRVVISDGITHIGDFAFGSCTKLKEVSFGKDVSVIGACVFHNCTALSSITIPSNVKTLGVGAFLDATALSDVTIEEGLQTIQYGAFVNCSSLLNLLLPSSLTSLNAGTFALSGISSIVLPESIAGISSYTFYSCKNLTQIKFLGDIKYINEGAFNGCNSNLLLRIPESCTTINPSAITNFRIICYAGSYGEEFCKQYVKKNFYQVRTHEYLFDRHVSATCAEKGYDLYYCEECEGYRKENYTDSIGHVMGDWTISSVATPDTDGQLQCVCKTCDITEQKSYPYHTPGDADLDDTLTVYDVIVMLQQMAGIKEFDDVALSAGDLNLNYRIDAEDATLLLQRVSGKDNKFPSEQYD